MSETAPAPKQPEALPAEQHELLTAHTKSHAEVSVEAAAEQSAELAQEAHKAIQEARPEQTASDARERLKEAQKGPQEASANYIDKAMQQISGRRVLKNVQRQLPAPQRALSKLIHQPVVRGLSEATGKTVSRPSGLLGGGILAFIGSAGYYYLTNYTGMHYNPTVFLALFVGGFVLGLILEFMVFAATASRRSH